MDTSGTVNYILIGSQPRLYNFSCFVGTLANQRTVFIIYNAIIYIEFSNITYNKSISRILLFQ